MESITGSNDLNLNTQIMNVTNGGHKFYSKMISVKDDDRFIGTIYYNNQILLRFEYVLIGSYSKKNNMFIWAESFPIIHKSMTIQSNNVRTELTKIDFDEKDENKISDFLTKSYSVIPTITMYDFLARIEKGLNNKDKNIITFRSSENKDIIHICMTVRIIINSLK